MHPLHGSTNVDKFLFGDAPLEHMLNELVETSTKSLRQNTDSIPCPSRCEPLATPGFDCFHG